MSVSFFLNWTGYLTGQRGFAEVTKESVLKIGVVSQITWGAQSSNVSPQKWSSARKQARFTVGR